MPTQTLSVLLAEDRAADVLPIHRALAHAFPSVNVLAVGDLDTFRVALENGQWSVILVAAENVRCRVADILNILREDDLAVPLVVLECADSPTWSADGAHGSSQRICKDDTEQLVRAVERAARICAPGSGRRVSDGLAP